jgi:hypothetical protein
MEVEIEQRRHITLFGSMSHSGAISIENVATFKDNSQVLAFFCSDNIWNHTDLTYILADTNEILDNNTPL